MIMHNLLLLKYFSVFSLRSAYFWLWLSFDNTATHPEGARNDPVPYWGGIKAILISWHGYRWIWLILLNNHIRNLFVDRMI